MIAALPADEDNRLQALADTGLLDTPPEHDFDDVVALAASICEMPISLITLVDEHRQWFKSTVGLSESETSRDIAFCAHAILQSELFVVPDASLDPRFAANPLVTGDPFLRFYAGMPLNVEGHNLGTLCVIDRQPRNLSRPQQSALAILARQVTAQIALRSRVRALQTAIEQRDSVTVELQKSRTDLKRANALLQSLAVTDSLTSLRNRRSFEEQLQREFHLCQRTDNPLSLLLLDIDHFKRINDTHGHLTGDEVLKSLARKLEKLFRRSDIIARYGGEEFAVILPDTADVEAMLLARKVCSTIAAEPLRIGGVAIEYQALTVSIGVATFSAAITEPKAMMGLADQGLYKAKGNGRNTCAFGSQPD